MRKNGGRSACSKGGGHGGNVRCWRLGETTVREVLVGEKGGQGGIPRCKMLGEAMVGEVLVGGKMVPMADQGVRCREKQRWAECL